jgi:hypothetical protein
MSNDHTTPSTTTRGAEAEAVQAAHAADRGPTPEEEDLAGQTAVDPGVAEAHREANERGAAQKGEGRVI